MGFLENSVYPPRAADADVVIASVIINIGAAGAVTSVTGSPGISAVNAGAGLFTLTYPPCVAAHIITGVKSAANTASESLLTARNATAGTATLRTNVAGGTATNPASGDELHVLIYARTSSA